MLELTVYFSARLVSLEYRLDEFESIRSDVQDITDDIGKTKENVAGLLAAEDIFPNNLSILIQNLPADEEETPENLAQNWKDSLKIAWRSRISIS